MVSYCFAFNKYYLIILSFTFWIFKNNQLFLILSTLGQFCYYVLSLLQFSKISGKILDSLKLFKFQIQNMKAMAKDKIVNIAVTYS